MCGSKVVGFNTHMLHICIKGWERFLCWEQWSGAAKTVSQLCDHYMATCSSDLSLIRGSTKSGKPASWLRWWCHDLATLLVIWCSLSEHPWGGFVLISHELSFSLGTLLAYQQISISAFQHNSSTCTWTLIHMDVTQLFTCYLCRYCNTILYFILFWCFDLYISNHLFIVKLPFLI